MKVMADNATVYFDMDETLVELVYGVGEPTEDDELVVEHYGKVKIIPQYETIEALKRHKEQGATIVVWHHGGTTWPKKVLKLLKLEKYVDLVVSKPSIYYDDMPPEFILGTKGEVEE